MFFFISAVPDVTKYVNDKSTGYQYDTTTGLFYDPNSTYYWNSVIQKYLYWDNDKCTYMLAPSFSNSMNQIVSGNGVEMAGNQESEKKHKVEKQDKVKVAKKIAKDMERWAKTLNQKKDNMSIKVATDNFSGFSSASADIGFSVLEKKHTNMTAAPPTYFKQDIPVEPQEVSSTSNNVAPLVAAYGGESESSGDDEAEDLLDYAKLICNLCKRQLVSAESLTKHAKLSTLHKQNLEARKSKKNADKEKIVYRDRAKERRMKYGDPDEPQPSKLKEKYLKSREVEMTVPSTKVDEPIGAENVGNRLLQKMGWTEGQGLGKQNQGRTTIIQVGSIQFSCNL